MVESRDIDMCWRKYVYKSLLFRNFAAYKGK